MKAVYFTTLITCLLIGGCRSPNEPPPFENTETAIISGRAEKGERRPIYRLKVPSHWIRHDPEPGDPVTDTTKPLTEFIIMENEGLIRINIHNFPSESVQERPSPEAQVARWERQYEKLDRVHSTTISQSFSGYSGLMFFCEGLLNGKETITIAWALQLPPEHYRMLTHANTPKEESLVNQMRADVTIKAVGPKTMMQKHLDSITKSARTFELIREIPSRP